MREKISFLILTHQGSTCRQFVASKKRLKLVSAVLIGIFFTGMIAAGYLIFDYRKLHKSVAEITAMENLILSQNKEILEQREEIQAFAKKINLLKDQLFELREYQDRVREIADLKEVETDDPKGGAEEKSSLGVGGPLPEDIDPDVDLKEKHSQLINEMHQQADWLKVTSARQGEEIKSLLEQLLEKQKRADCTPSIRPVKGMTTSKFGYRRSAFTNKREFHKGYDIGAPKGTPIVATADGVVQFVGRKGSFGKMIVIDHGYGYITRYAHVAKILKRRGEHVKRGDVIALVGNTGRSTGPHLHYEVVKNGVAMNPQKYFIN